METGENQRQVSSGPPTPLEISQLPRDSHFSTAPKAANPSSKTKKQRLAARAA
jgi:hypothetical protein